MTTIQDLLSIWDGDSEAIEQIEDCIWFAEDTINERYDCSVEAEIEEGENGESQIIVNDCPSEEVFNEFIEVATTYASENYPELFF